MPRSSHFYIVFPLKKSFTKYNVQNKSFICRQNWHLNVETIYMLYISVYSMQRKNRCQSWKSRANRNKCRLERPCKKGMKIISLFFGVVIKTELLRFKAFAVQKIGGSISALFTGQPGISNTIDSYGNPYLN